MRKNLSFSFEDQEGKPLLAITARKEGICLTQSLGAEMQVAFILPYDQIDDLIKALNMLKEKASSEK